MTVSRRPLAWGIVLCVAALLLVALGAGLQGPLNPACAKGEPCSGQLIGGILKYSALPVALVGGTLIAIWMGRRADAEDPRD